MASKANKVRPFNPDGGDGMQWAVIVFDCATSTTHVEEWRETKAEADTEANTLLAEAAKDDITITVFVAQVRSIG